MGCAVVESIRRERQVRYEDEEERGRVDLVVGCPPALRGWAGTILVKLLCSRGTRETTRRGSKRFRSLRESGHVERALVLQ
jgi:hypothetical protein